MRKTIPLIIIFILTAIAVNAAPTVSITSPLDGEVIRASDGITIYANATDNIGLNKCELYVNSILNQTQNVTGTSNTISFPLLGLDDAVYSYYVKCYDSTGNSEQSLTRKFEIDHVNDAPVLTKISDQTISTVTPLLIKLSATDYNNDSLNYSITTSESGVNIITIGSDKYVNYIPSEIKNFTITATVSDGRGGTDSTTFAVEVQPPKAGIQVGTPAFEESDRQRHVESSFIIKNTGTMELTNITITSSALSKYNISFSNDYIPKLEIGEQTSVTIRAYLPEALDAGKNFIGKFTVNAQGKDPQTGNIEAVAQTVNINVDAVNELQLRSLDFKSDYFTDIKSAEKKDDLVIEVAPGDIVDIVLEVKNDFPNNDKYGWDINDIEVTITISDMDDGGDIEHTFYVFDLDAQDNKALSFEFKVPYTIRDRDRYEIQIDIVGEDENGAEHSTKWTGKFEGKRKSYSIEFTELKLSNLTVSCDRTIYAEITMMNTGKQSVSDAVLYVSSPDLLIESRDLFSINRDPDNDDNVKKLYKTFTVPEFKQPGTYTIWFVTYYNIDQPSMRLSRTITIKDCVPEAPEPAAPAQQPSTTQPVPPAQQPAEEEYSEQSTGVYVKKTYGTSGIQESSGTLQRYEVLKDGKTDKAMMIAAITGGNLIVLGAALVFLLKGSGGAAAGKAGEAAAKTIIVDDFDL